ncbi:Pentatricopeptide repeat-containing protein [Diplonema papillatum]|nr:Pentatricopeptide repeat-containing protein [Diplonema papillatum]
MRRTAWLRIFYPNFGGTDNVNEKFAHTNHGRGLDKGSFGMADAATAGHLRTFAATLRQSDASRHKKLLKEFNGLQPAGHEVGKAASVVFLSLLIDMKHPRLAERYFDQVKADPANLLSLSAITVMFRLYARDRNPQAQSVLLSFMLDKGYEPNLLVFTELVKCQVLCGNKAGAFDAFEEAKRLKLPLDELIYGYLLAIVPPSESEAVLKDMEQRKLETKTAHVYNSLLQGCALSGDVKAAERVFARVRYPDKFVYRNLLWVYSCAMDYAGAVEVCERAKKNRVQLTTDTLRTVVKLCIRLCEAPQAPAPETRRAYLADCERLTAHCATQYQLNREMIHLSVAAGDGASVKKYVGRHLISGEPITPTISDLVRRAGFELDENALKLEYGRNRHSKEWATDKAKPTNGTSGRCRGGKGKGMIRDRSIKDRKCTGGKSCEDRKGHKGGNSKDKAKYTGGKSSRDHEAKGKGKAEVKGKRTDGKSKGHTVRSKIPAGNRLV